VSADDDRIIQIEAGGPSWTERLPALAVAVSGWAA